ncbi:MAG: response regulator transcription factor [Bacteroidetes bacterium]|nr:response regulator transcription factor [Bacteroidota bacterium]
MKAINILIADDHQMFVDGLTALLSDAEDVNVVGTAVNGADAVALVGRHPEADILIVDISMPVMDGISATRAIRKDGSGMKILALTQNADSGSITRAVKAGVDGYVIKTSKKEEFLEAIRTVAAGEQYFSEHVKNALILSLGGRDEKILGGELPISPREKEILAMIAREFTTNEIAERLFLSPYTVETHRKNLIHKLGVRNTAGLVRIAVQTGLIGEDSE